MDNQAVVDQLIKKLSFEVEAVPKNTTKKDASDESSKPDPLNVKIKVRKKDDDEQFNQAILIKDQPNTKTGPQKIRLVNSDETLMSFDVLLEAEFEKKTPRKSRKNIFGLCLGAADDDEREHKHETGYSAKIIDNSSSSKSDGILRRQFMLSKNTYQVFGAATVQTKEKTFLGKCKPGGCLDPPFGEDKYSYKPRTQEQKPELQKDVTKVQLDKKPVVDETADIEEPDKKRRSKEKVPQKLKGAAEEVDDTGRDEGPTTDTVITYPPHDDRTALRTRPVSEDKRHSSDKISKRKSSTEPKSAEPKSVQSINESSNSFFTPPKGMSRVKEDLGISDNVKHDPSKRSSDQRKQKPDKLNKEQLASSAPLKELLKSDYLEQDSDILDVNDIKPKGRKTIDQQIDSLPDYKITEKKKSIPLVPIPITVSVPKKSDQVTDKVPPKGVNDESQIADDKAISQKPLKILDSSTSSLKTSQLRHSFTKPDVDKNNAKNLKDFQSPKTDVITDDKINKGKVLQEKKEIFPLIIPKTIKDEKLPTENTKENIVVDQKKKYQDKKEPSIGEYDPNAKALLKTFDTIKLIPQIDRDAENILVGVSPDKDIKPRVDAKAESISKDITTDKDLKPKEELKTKIIAVGIPADKATKPKVDTKPEGTPMKTPADKDIESRDDEGEKLSKDIPTKEGVTAEGDLKAAIIPVDISTDKDMKSKEDTKPGLIPADTTTKKDTKPGDGIKRKSILADISTEKDTKAEYIPADATTTTDTKSKDGIKRKSIPADTSTTEEDIKTKYIPAETTTTKDTKPKDGIKRKSIPADISIDKDIKPKDNVVIAAGNILEDATSKQVTKPKDDTNAENIQSDMSMAKDVKPKGDVKAPRDISVDKNMKLKGDLKTEPTLDDLTTKKETKPKDDTTGESVFTDISMEQGSKPKYDIKGEYIPADTKDDLTGKIIPENISTKDSKPKDEITGKIIPAGILADKETKQKDDLKPETSLSGILTDEDMNQKSGRKGEIIPGDVTAKIDTKPKDDIKVASVPVDTLTDKDKTKKLKDDEKYENIPTDISRDKDIKITEDIKAKHIPDVTTDEVKPKEGIKIESVSTDIPTDKDIIPSTDAKEDIKNILDTAKESDKTIPIQKPEFERRQSKANELSESQTDDKLSPQLAGDEKTRMSKDKDSHKEIFGEAIATDLLRPDRRVTPILSIKDNQINDADKQDKTSGRDTGKDQSLADETNKLDALTTEGEYLDVPTSNTGEIAPKDLDIKDEMKTSDIDKLIDGKGVDYELSENKKLKLQYPTKNENQIDDSGKTGKIETSVQKGKDDEQDIGMGPDKFHILNQKEGVNEPTLIPGSQIFDQNENRDILGPNLNENQIEVLESRSRTTSLASPQDRRRSQMIETISQSRTQSFIDETQRLRSSANISSPFKDDTIVTVSKTAPSTKDIEDISKILETPSSIQKDFDDKQRDRISTLTRHSLEYPSKKGEKEDRMTSETEPSGSVGITGKDIDSQRKSSYGLDHFGKESVKKDSLRESQDNRFKIPRESIGKADKEPPGFEISVKDRDTDSKVLPQELVQDDKDSSKKKHKGALDGTKEPGDKKKLSTEPLPTSDIQSKQDLDDKKKTISLDLAFHSYTNDKNQRILRTVDTTNEIKRYPNDSITLINSEMDLTSRVISVPIDSTLDMTIKIQKNNERSKSLPKKIGAKTIPPFQTSSDIASKSLDTATDPKSSSQRVHYIKGSKEVYSTLSEVYEHELVPLRTTIRNLKDEIDDLAAQQTVFRKKVHCVKKSKCPRLLHINKKCGPCRM
ncbi:uncharacterized protein LOC142975693 [Anticarsia gemmatalis]|uniref:uncharacterized protein LOC142975693 n=1 Tax=Anticarsia gemmatalis TaxID=129554 RepID=UPI003F76EE2A